MKGWTREEPFLRQTTTSKTENSLSREQPEVPVAAQHSCFRTESAVSDIKLPVRPKTQ